MNKEDILHLGRLARIKIEDGEVAGLERDITAVLEYVSVVNDIAGDSGILKHVGPVHNVFREDVVTNEPGGETSTLLAEAPLVENDQLVVKKILQND